MRMVKVDGHRVCVVRTDDGVHALDHACPHEGYGLTQGELGGDLLTCAWHNWKFRVTDGACVQGEEAVQVHDVDIDLDGGVRVTLVVPIPRRRPQLLASLRSGIEREYTGQVARDVVRLLQADANPGELIWEAIAYGAPVQSSVGATPSRRPPTASPWSTCTTVTSAPCRSCRGSWASPKPNDSVRSTNSRRRHPRPNRPGRRSGRRSRPNEIAGAGNRARRDRARRRANDLRPWFTDVVSDHLLSYGHGAIYTQKAFELLDMIGWDRAHTVLPHLVPTIVYGTREDKLPYMRPFMRSLGALDLRRWRTPPPIPPGPTTERCATSCWRGIVVPRSTLWSTALRQGAGVDGLLDVVVDTVAERMLRYDVAGEFDFADDFGWLDITHGLTYANAGAGTIEGGRAGVGRHRSRAARVVHRVPRAVDRSTRVAHGGG